MAFLVGVDNIEDRTYTTEFADYMDAAAHYDHLCQINAAKKLYTGIYLCEILEKEE